MASELDRFVAASTLNCPGSTAGAHCLFRVATNFTTHSQASLAVFSSQQLYLRSFIIGSENLCVICDQDFIAFIGLGIATGLGTEVLIDLIDVDTLPQLGAIVFEVRHGTIYGGKRRVNRFVLEPAKPVIFLYIRPVWLHTARGSLAVHAIPVPSLDGVAAGSTALGSRAGSPSHPRR